MPSLFTFSIEFAYILAQTKHRNMKHNNSESRPVPAPPDWWVIIGLVASLIIALCL